MLSKESYEGILPLQYAILFGNIKVAEILLKHGASIYCRLEGMPLLHLSLSFASNFIFNKFIIPLFIFKFI